MRADAMLDKGDLDGCAMWSDHSAGMCLGAFVFEYAVLSVRPGDRAGSMNLIACG